MSDFDDNIWSPDGGDMGGRGPRPTPRRGGDPTSYSQALTDDDDPGAGKPASRSIGGAPEGPRRILMALGLILVGALLGAGLVLLTTERGSDTIQSDAASKRTIVSTTTAATKATTTSTAAATTAVPVTTNAPLVVAPRPATKDWAAAAQALGPITLPSDCPLPLGVPESLPNAARDYRGGVHEGIDFICGERGRNAVAAMPGQVLIADNSYDEPQPAERQRILDLAKGLGFTPPWTLAMLFGRFVVIDHGVIPSVGHVVSIYAHLDEIDPAIRPGLDVKAGTRVGEIGNRGTESAGTGEVRPQAIHLHWELHIDDQFLGQGLDAQRTSDVYRALFGR